MKSPQTAPYADYPFLKRLGRSSSGSNKPENAHPR